MVGNESPIRTFWSGGVLSTPLNFWEDGVLETPLDFWAGGVLSTPLDFWVGGVLPTPLAFLDEGGIFSLECPRATAVFRQTVLVWSGVVLRALPLIKPLVCGRGWGVYVEPPP